MMLVASSTYPSCVLRSANAKEGTFHSTNATGDSFEPEKVCSLSITLMWPMTMGVTNLFPVRPCHLSMASDRRAYACFSVPLGKTPSLRVRVRGIDDLLGCGFQITTVT